jgi:hypothetical protein
MKANASGLLAGQGPPGNAHPPTATDRNQSRLARVRGQTERNFELLSDECVQAGTSERAVSRGSAIQPDTNLC